MKKLLFLLSYGLTLQTQAQTIDSTFFLLDKTEITTEILYPHFSNDSSALWFNYDGIKDSIANSSRWKQAYSELTHFFVTPHSLPSISTLIENAEYEINVNRRIPLMVLNYDYNLFKAHAMDSNLIQLENGKFTDVVNRTGSPYLQQHLFMAAPFTEEILGDSLTFFISTDFCFSNQSLPSSFQIDFADGNGFRTVSVGQTVSVNYTNINNAINKSNSIPVIKVKANIGSSNWSSSSTMKTSTCQGGYPLPDTHFKLTADIPFTSSFTENSPIIPLKIYAEAQIGIKYGTGNAGELRKPIIFVEGIDFGRQPHRLTGTFDENGDFGWCGLWGQDTDFLEFQDSPTLLNQLLANGYDVILIDFRDGATFIERNAMVLVKLLQYIQNQPQVGFTRDPSVVIGASMGGQVARYA